MQEFPMLRARLSHVSGILLSIAVTTSPLTARAQSDGAAQGGPADRLWDEAGVAMDHQDYATACPKLEEVVRLRPDGLGAKMKLARCYEGAGRLASAWELWLAIESLAGKAKQPDRQKTAHDRAEALKPKLATLTIVVPDTMRALPGLEVKCDGNVIGPTHWGDLMVVDKGRHVIEVTATGRERRERVEVVEADGAAKTVTIDLPAAVKPPPDVKPAEPKRSVVPAVVLGVLAAGAVGTGIGLMVLSSSKYADADALVATLLATSGSCVSRWASYDAKLCPDLQDKLKAGATFHNIAVGTFIAGGAAAAGTALYLLWPPPRAKPTAQAVLHDLRLTPILGPVSNGLLVSGSF